MSSFYSSSALLTPRKSSAIKITNPNTKEEVVFSAAATVITSSPADKLKTPGKTVLPIVKLPETPKERPHIVIKDPTTGQVKPIVEKEKHVEAKPVVLTKDVKPAEIKQEIIIEDIDVKVAAPAKMAPVKVVPVATKVETKAVPPTVIQIKTDKGEAIKSLPNENKKPIEIKAIEIKPEALPKPTEVPSVKTVPSTTAPKPSPAVKVIPQSPLKVQPEAVAITKEYTILSSIEGITYPVESPSVQKDGSFKYSQEFCKL